ncbi:HD domain-containing phosphohydrolase [Bdellovibrio sp. HCB185ZH]|uniref:HD domain-containing phosphohydrolase n=1 Tax=Bdellovibrio sp. HCB185ZH TaxID=3394235 RepID=UPI0039A6C463
MRSLDLTAVSQDPRFTKRATELAHLFSFEFENFDDPDTFFEKTETYKSITCILLDCAKIEKPNEAAGMVQVACQVAADSYIIAVVNSKLKPEDARIVKTSGASLVLMENEFYSTSKLEFVTTQVIRSAFIPIKIYDLMPDTETAFPLFYMMPANKKFLKVAKPETKLNSAFLKKFSEMGELYLRRQDLKNWVEYSRSFNSNDEASALRRCRLQFLQMSQSFLALALMISDQSSAASFALGKELYGTCENFAKSLLTSLGEVKNPFDVINSSSVGDFGSLERAPAIAAYAAVLSQEAKIGSALEVMIAALLSDIGYLELSPSTSAKLRAHEIEAMHGEELMEYQKHPIYSLNQCLARKIPLSEPMKMMILQSHERMDQKGFPHRINPDKILEEAMLIRFCWELDGKTQVRIGETRPDIKSIVAELANLATSEKGNYSIGFTMKTAPVLKEIHLKPETEWPYQ